jgi:lipopolysaccharide heptosyltransferase II
MESVHPPRRLLVVSLAQLGDALLITPALRALRESYPQAQITVLTTAAGAAALRDGPQNEIITFEKHRLDHPRALLQPTNWSYALRLAWRLRAGYDRCVLLHHLTTRFGTLKYAALLLATGAPRRYGRDNGRGWFLTDRVVDHGFGAQHQAAYWLDIVGLLGAQTNDRQPRFGITAAEQQRAADLLGDDDRPLVTIHPGSGSYAPARRWPAHRFAALADRVIEDGCRVVLVGGAEEAPLRRHVRSAMRHTAAILDLGGQTTLGELAAVLARSALYVGNDSGVMHLASSVGTAVVAVFGPTEPRTFGPFSGTAWEVERRFANGVDVWRSGTHRALKASIACSPCLYRGQRLGTPGGCPDRTCLQRIGVDQVLSVVRQQLAGQNDHRCGSTISSTSSSDAIASTR